MGKEKEKNVQSAEAEESPLAGMNIDAEQIKKDIDSGKAFRRGNQYPYAVFIICGAAAVGHLLGSYVFRDTLVWTSAGMAVGIILSVVYGRIYAKKDTPESVKA